MEESIKSPFEDNRLILSHSKVTFFLHYARRRFRTDPNGTHTLGSAAVALLLCASADPTCYEQHYRASVWDLIDISCSRWPTCDQPPTSWDCLVNHISFLLLKHEQKELRRPDNNGLKQLLQNAPHVQKLWNMLIDKIDIECLCAWPVTVDAYIEGEFHLNKQHLRSAFVAWTSMCEHGYFNDNRVAAALSHSMYRIRRPFDHIGLALPHDSTLLILRLHNSRITSRVL
ncbi:hypothetical protein OBBRIDRAFT_246631 [Obba rivulosa]|uniref:Uncharacterized protein n=1 Tax=Obba rivulosa TaxID=1052685 RepID=A0A8E2ALC4_9APHY|nr:hypothetical protein OBBRIDRAFT_246631 [Obba rivulosa]